MSRTKKIEVTVGVREARQIEAALAEDVPVQILVGSGVPDDACCFPAAFCKGSRPTKLMSRRSNPSGLLNESVLEAAVEEYLDAADFTDSPTKPWSEKTRRNAARDVRQFFTENEEDCLAFAEIVRPGASVRDAASLCATDFWLTRNGHGAGFWDRGAGSVGKRLTDAAKSYGERYVFDGRTVAHIE